MSTYQILNSILDQMVNITVTYLSLNQTLQIKSNSMEIEYQNGLVDYLANRSIQIGDGQIVIPSSLCTIINLSDCSYQLLTTQSFFMQSPYPGANNNDIILNGSKTLALSIYNNDLELNIYNSSYLFQFSIPVDENAPELMYY